MNYIDIFKKKIEEKRSASEDQNFLDEDFLNIFFNSIKLGVIKTAAFLSIKEVDELTLFSYFETALKEYLSVYPIDPGISHSLTKKGFKTWLNNERENHINWEYSNRYFEYLLKSGRSNKVVDETKQSSYSILSKMADPMSSIAVYNKGLVVGAVQSGKTANFNAVINRAIDSGYEIIIVLSGIMEDLRSQTQRRIEKDIIGEGKIDSGETTGAKGAGKIKRFGVSANSSQTDHLVSI